MKKESDEKRLEEIQEVYRSLGLESEEVRKYLASLPSLFGQTEQKRPIIFIEAGTTSYSQGKFKYARLESTPE